MSQHSFDHSERYCVFQDGDDWYGIPALAVSSVVPVPTITQIPLSDPVLEGICHIRNEFLPVINLQSLAQSHYATLASSEQQLLVLLGPTGRWGLLIDQVVALVALEASLSASNDQQDQWSQVTFGSASYQNQILKLLDPAVMYQYASNLLEMYWQCEHSPAPLVS